MVIHTDMVQNHISDTALLKSMLSVGHRIPAKNILLSTGSAVDAIARQPEAEGKISKALLLGCALAEATAIYGFVIALLIILFLK